jgi:MFS transporter, BCD family, chlorophyll transporter
MGDELKGLSPARNTKIGFFHLGSGMADVLTSGVWNRIMITDLGVNATPVGLLVSLRYFLAPLGIWAGRISDRQSFLGFRRLFWIWLGRVLMVLSTFGLGFGTSELMRDASNTMSWISIVVSMIFFSLGNAISGSTFLALVYDRSTDEQRGRVVGIVWTFLLLGFTIGGIVFGSLLKNDAAADRILTPDKIFSAFMLAGGIFAALWFFSLLGEERRGFVPEVSQEAETKSSLRADLSLVWQNPSMRLFFLFLTLSMFFAFSQDLILEPFGGEVFNMDVVQTSRFTGYWGTASIVASLFSLWLLRRRGWSNTRLSQVGMYILIATFASLTISSFLKLEFLMNPNLVLLGAGLGFWNIGTLGLMMDMSPLGRAGTFLGFWSMSVTLARGGGVSMGGIIRDIGLNFGDHAVAYGIAFLIGAIGLAVATYCLNSIHIEAYQSAMSEGERTTAVLAGSMD